MANLETVDRQNNTFSCLGTCLCRSHIQGKRCTEVRKGFYVASFYHPKYEAEDAMGSYEATSYFTGIDQVFTGRGYGKIGFNQFISFTVNLPTSFSDYYVVIRYTSIEDANITLRLSISSCNVSACHTTNNFTLSHLPHGAGLAWRSQEAISFLRGQEYHLNLTYVGGMYPNSTIEIDSLGLLPNVRDVRIYEIAQDDGSVHGMTFQQIEDCWNNSTAIAGSQNSSDICRNVTFSAMAEVFDGAIRKYYFYLKFGERVDKTSKITKLCFLCTHTSIYVAAFFSLFM